MKEHQMDSNVMLSEARGALASATGRAADLIANAADLSVPARSSDWSLQQVAAHLVIGAGMWTEIANGVSGPLSSLDRASLRAESDRRHADIPETDRVKLSRLMIDAVEEFLEATADRDGDDLVTFHMGLPYTILGLVGSRLGEVLLHGYDMAAALGRPWPIDPVDAAVVLSAYAPMFGVFVDPERTRGLTAGFRIELRSVGAMTVRFTDGAYSLQNGDTGPVDATISADPVAYLMVTSGRLTRYEALALGLIGVDGNRPDLAIGFFDLFRYP
jgi:uncharacterized protein (TIGR03083 family)